MRDEEPLEDHLAATPNSAAPGAPAPRSATRSARTLRSPSRSREDEEALRAFAASAQDPPASESRPDVRGADTRTTGARAGRRSHNRMASGRNTACRDGRRTVAGQEEAETDVVPRRRAKPRRVRVRRMVAWGLVLGALGGGGGWALTSPRWQVAAVDVRGQEQTPPALVQAVGRELLGQNWLRADLAAAQSRLAKLPTVRAARVEREWNQWPPRLLVRLEERQPWVRLGGGATWWAVDRVGVAYRRATRDDRTLYSVTSTALEPESLRAGKPVPPKVWDGVRRLGLALESSKIDAGGWSVRRAYLDRANMASLRLRPASSRATEPGRDSGTGEEMLVRLGDGEWARKLERAERALEFFEARGEGAESLNLVSFSKPTWTPRRPAAPPSTPSAAETTTATNTVPGTSPSTSPPAAQVEDSRENKTREGSSTTGAPNDRAPGDSAGDSASEGANGAA